MLEPPVFHELAYTLIFATSAFNPTMLDSFSTSPSVLLIGASGAFGKPLLSALIQKKSSFSRLAVLAQNDAKAAQFASLTSSHGVEVVIGSILSEASYQGFTHVISCVGNPLLRLQPAMIEAAIAATGGHVHFYASEWNSDIANKAIYPMRYFRDKQTTRAHLAAKSKELSTFRYTLIVTGIFTEWAVGEFYGFDHEKNAVDIFGSSDARVGVTSIPDIAKYTIESLLIQFEGTNPNVPGERTIRVQGDTLSFQSLVDKLGKARGVQYKVTYGNPEVPRGKQEEARLDSDEVGEMTWSIRQLLASGHGVADGAEGSKLDNDLFSFKPETAEETFKRVYGA